MIETRYFTGKPCLRGHIAERMICNRQCVVCLKESKCRFPQHSRTRWRKANPAKMRVYRASYRKRNLSYRIGESLRSRIRRAIKDRTNRGSAADLLGCSIVDALKHIESLWYTGMTWELWGYGPGKWQIDHKRPISSFNLHDPAQQAVACHYSNLQPLWWDDHCKKTAQENRCRKIGNGH